MLLQTVIEVVY